MGETDLQAEHKQDKIQSNGGVTTLEKLGILVADFVLCYAWAFWSAITRLIVHNVLGLGHDHIVSYAFRIFSMFLFAWLESITIGGSHNPLSVLPGAISADFNRFLFTVGARIPAQVLGSILGVRLLKATFSDVGQGPTLNVEIRKGALTEGVLAFIMAVITMELSRSLSESFFRRNWIQSLSKMSLQILTSDLTGACINPATAVGWAYARGDHVTKEHIHVYWLAPVEATLLAVLVFRSLLCLGRDDKAKKGTKSE